MTWKEKKALKTVINAVKFNTKFINNMAMTLPKIKVVMTENFPTPDVAARYDEYTKKAEEYSMNMIQVLKDLESLLDK